MEGFYTKQEAAQVLGVSIRQINNYFTEDKLTRIYHGKRAWVPKEDVEALYTKVTRGPRISPRLVHELSERVVQLEGDVSTLKLGLGFGKSRDPRTPTDLLLLRQRFVDALAKPTWSTKGVSAIADELMSIQEEELRLLLQECGSTAWVPLSDLSRRMLIHIEGLPDYPLRGLDILATRLVRSRDRFLGLLYASTKTRTSIPQHEAKRAFEVLEVPPNTIEQHIVAYLAAP